MAYAFIAFLVGMGVNTAMYFFTAPIMSPKERRSTFKTCTILMAVVVLALAVLFEIYG